MEFKKNKAKLEKTEVMEPTSPKVAKEAATPQAAGASPKTAEPVADVAAPQAVDTSKESKADAKARKAEAAEQKKAAKKEAKAKKSEAKKQKQGEKRKKKAEKKAKKIEKRGGKPSIWQKLWDAVLDTAASWVFVHDKLQAKVDRFFAALLYSIVYEINDMRNRYKQNYVSMLTTFFSTIVVICMMLLVFNHQIAYQYSYNGRVLGYVSDQEQVNNILEVAGEKLSELNDAKIKFTIGQNITFKQVPSSGKDTDTTDQVLNKLTYMTEIDVQAYGIFEDGKLKAVVESESKAESTLNAVISHYRTPDEGMSVDSIKYKNSVEVRPINVMLTSVMTQSEAEDMLINGGTLTIDHIVMEDETESTIEDTYGVSKDEINIQEDESDSGVESDDDTADTAAGTDADSTEADSTAADGTDSEESTGAASGDRIEIKEKVEPIVVSMTESGTMSEVIKYKTVKKKTKTMYKGDTEVIQKGVNGRQTITGTLVYENGKEVSRDIESKEVLKESVDKIMLVGTNDRPKWLPTGTYIVPVKNEVITSYFGSRWGRIHGGLDFGMPIGTPIYASDGGTVTRASYYAGYGLCIEVEHDGGTFTRYGHCSSVCVSVGDKVAQGEKIGEVGNTGNSTGPHLHFEIHPGGGSYVDPYPYLYGSNKGNSKNYE
jgi:murein DD-endopeptidase MepM/ murein hydrolase activator NlpD